MSHITDGQMRVRDLDALADACEACGLELRRGQTEYAWWGAYLGDSDLHGGRDPRTFGHCEHAIGRKGARPSSGPNGEWEIGVVAAADGDGFDLLLDTFGAAGGRLLEKAGPGLDRLRKEYAVAAAMRQARAKMARQGFVPRRENLADGRVLVRLVRR